MGRKWSVYSAGRRSFSYRDWRKAVLEKHGSRCAECGSYYMVECHHIEPWEEKPELRFLIKNGICLCFSCHAKKHLFMKDGEYLKKAERQRRRRKIISDRIKACTSWA